MKTKSPTPTRSGWCHLEAERWSHERCTLLGCPCDCHHEVQPSTPVLDLSGITVVYLRHGDDGFEAGWHCREDAERFARWLSETGAAIEVEVIEP